MTTTSSGIKLTTVNHVLTVVRDAKRSAEFYCGVLGFKHIPSMVENPKITWLQLPSGVMLHLLETEEAPVAPDSVHHAFEVDDFDASRRSLEAAGIAIERSGERKDGQRFMFILDPDRNQVELCTPSGF